MSRAITALTMAGVIALATAAVPTRAEANPVWIVPAVIIGGFVVAASAANARAYYAPEGTVYVRPRVATRCQIVRERTSAGWRRVKVCS